MAVVQTTIAAARQPHGHKHAVVKSGHERVVLRCTSPKVDHGDLAGAWKQVDRDGDRPLLGMTGRRLHTAKVEAIVARNDGSPIEDVLVHLINVSRDPVNRVTLANYGFLEAGPWRLTDITISSDMRKFGTNQVTRANVTLTLTEAVLEPGPRAAKKTKGKKHTGGANAGSSAGKPRMYTVRSGDTLSRIAAKFYGDANLWHRIARANKIRRPDRIRVGQRLRIP